MARTLALFCLFLHFISGHSQSVGDVRTVSSGDWSNSLIWAVYNGNAWVWANAAPTHNSGVITIQFGHSVTVSPGAATTADQLNIEGNLRIAAGAQFALFNGQGIDLSIANAAAVITVEGGFYRQDGSEIANPHGAANFVFNAGSAYYHRYTNSFGNMPAATWHPQSTVHLTSFSNAAPIAANTSWSQTFGNIVYNCPSQKETVSFDGYLTAVRGDFSVVNTGNRLLRLSNTQSFTLSIGESNSPVGGSLTISNLARLAFSESGEATINVFRDFSLTSINSDGTFLTSSGVTNLNIFGNFNMSGSSSGKLFMAGTGSTGVGNLNLFGNFSFLSGRISESGAGSARGNIRFVGTGEQQFISNGIVQNWINYYVGPNSILQLGTQIVAGGSSSSFQCDGTVVLGSLDPLGALQANTTGGNIRTPVQHRAFSPGSQIIYAGAAQQAMGDGQPVSSGLTTRINNSNGVLLVTNAAVYGDLVLESGNLSLNDRTIALNGGVTYVNGRFVGSSLSKMGIGGSSSGPVGSLLFAEGSSELDVLAIYRTGANVSATIVAPLKINTRLNLTSGTIINNSTLLLENGCTILRYPAGALAGNSPVCEAGERYNVTYTSSSPGSGPYANFQTGLELVEDQNMVGNVLVTMQQFQDQISLGRDVVINGLMELTKGRFDQREFTITMRGPFWDDNAAQFLANTGRVLFDGITTVRGSSVLFGNLGATAGSTVNFSTNFSVQGNVDFQPGSAIQISAASVTFSGSNAQTISANGAHFPNISIAKGNSQGITLLSTLNLSGVLQFINPSSNVNLQSNGYLNLLSTSDGAGNGTAGIYRLASGNRISGNVVVNRYISPEGRTWRYISSPITNASVEQLKDDFFVGGNFVDPSTSAIICGITANSSGETIYIYNEAAPGGMNDGYVAYPSPGNTAAGSPLQVGRGYAVFIRECTSPTVIDYVGPVNQGTLTLPVTFTSNGSVEGDGWNLVGNPYPSAIDWDAGWTKTRISPQIAIRDYAAKVFRYYEAGVTNEIANGQIAMGQAFWVRATGSSPLLRITENAKVTTSPEFFREAAPQIPNFMIALSNGDYEDYAYVKTVEQAKPSLDEFDAPKIRNPEFGLATVASDQVSMAINAIESLACGMEFPLKTEGLVPGKYAFRIDTRNYFPGFAFVLHDRYTNEDIMLSESPYVFTVTSDSASAEFNRFALRIDDQGSFSPASIAKAATCEGAVDVLVENAIKDREYGVWTVDGRRISPDEVSSGDRLSITFPATLLGGSSPDDQFVVRTSSACGSVSIASLPFTLVVGDPSIKTLMARNNCQTDAVQLVADTGDPELLVNWYERESDIVPVFTGAIFDVGRIGKTKTYFAEAESPLGCRSDRMPVTTEVQPVAAAELFASGNQLNLQGGGEQNEWFWNGESIAKNVTSLNMDRTGQYEVILSVMGCETTLSYSHEIVGINLYPNPMSDRLTITGITDDIHTITIVNAFGGELKTIYRKGENFAGEIDVQSLPDGVYLVVVRKGTEKLSHRIVKTSK